jgi:transcriptional antiterminator NusG
MIYAIRTTSGQEKTVARLLSSRIGLKKLPILSIFVPEVIKGYIFVESPGPHIVDEAITGMKHARGKTKGTIPIDSLEKFLITKPIIEELNEGNVVEVTGGPFKGLKAKITNVDKVKEEVTIELQEEGFAILPITVHADYVKPLEIRRGDQSGRAEGD